MRKTCRGNQDGFLGLVSILISLLFVIILVGIMLKRPVSDRETTTILKQQGIDTSSQATIVNGFTQKLKVIEQQQLDSEDKLFQDLQR